MNALVALVVVAQQKPKRIPIGSDLATIGKMRPGSYVADRNLTSLPTIKDLSEDKWATFTGNVYVLASKESGKVEVVNFVHGQRRSFDREKGVVEFGATLSQYLASVGKADIRIAEASYVSFSVVLPKDAKKLTGFDGTITFSAPNMKSEQALTLTLKKGKVTATMP